MAESLIPTEKEVATLPRWAQVAFAARCARRVLPLFRAGWPDAPEEHARAVERAVEVGEQSAARGTHADEDHRTAIEDAASAAARAARAVPGVPAAWSVAEAAVEVSYAASAGNAAPPVPPGQDPRPYAFAAHPAVKAALSAADAGRVRQVAEVTEAAIRQDYDRLTSLARSEGWGDTTPVPPAVFGPLWPDGPPPGWPVETSEGEEVVLEIEVPEGATDEVAAAFVRKLADQADDLHRALGGHGLKVEAVEVYGDDSAARRRGEAI